MGRVQEHNREIMASAQFRAEEMKVWPSPLEERMKAFLEENLIDFEDQKIFYICADDGYILRYYIADFYIPSKKIIIETDGKFHEEQKEYDDFRTKDIQKHFPGTTVIRWNTKDFNSYINMKKLLELIK